MMRLLYSACLFATSLAYAQTAVTDRISTNCGQSVECIHKYASVLPHFFRNISTTQSATSFGDTTVADNITLESVKSANFLVFDKVRGLEVLGPKPKYKYMFNISDDVHEAPVYVPSQNRLYLSQLTPGFLPQLAVDLNKNPPTLFEFISDPPVYAPNGGRYYKGKIIWGTDKGNTSVQSTEQLAGLKVLDPETNKTTTLLNNYFGYHFNGVDDLAVHKKTEDIWFTSPGLTDKPSQLPTATYRYNVTSGAVFVVDDTLQQPNGIAFNQDASIVYISDTGAGGLNAHGDPTFDTSRPRTIYAFDVNECGTQAYNKRAIYLSPGYIPDGLKVAANGYIVTANGRGVDILDPMGQLLVTIQTNFTVNNFAWAGPELKDLWLTGNGGIGKVEWDLAGQELQ